MITHELQQGTPEWHQFRAKHLNASDAPAMMGVSPYKTRTELLREKATGITAEVDDSTQRRFDDGHRFEALARPLAEKIVGQELYPAIGSEGKYAASFDGITMLEDIVFEHKTLNDVIRTAMGDNGNTGGLPDHYRVQMEHQLMVSGASKCLFMATKWEGDTLIEQVHGWYIEDLALRDRIVASWAQFNKELDEYVPPVEVAKPVPAVVAALPAVTWNLQGTQITSNLEKEVKPAVLALIEKYNFTPETDQDFADLKAFGDNARAAVIKSKAVRETVLANLADINAFNAGMLELEELLTKAAITAENVYKAENINRKNQLRAKGQERFDKHINELQASIKGVTVAFAAPDLAAATKNLRTLKSFGDAVETCVSNAIIAADALAADVRSKLEWYDKATGIEAGLYGFLFKDLQQLIGKPMDDFQLVITSRIEQAKAAEAAKLEAERERIRQEEEAKARAKVALEQETKAAAEHATHAMAEHIDIFSSSAVEKQEVKPAPSNQERPTRGTLIAVVVAEFGVSYQTAEQWLIEVFSTEQV